MYFLLKAYFYNTNKPRWVNKFFAICSMASDSCLLLISLWRTNELSRILQVRFITSFTNLISRDVNLRVFIGWYLQCWRFVLFLLIMCDNYIRQQNCDELVIKLVLVAANNTFYLVYRHNVRYSLALFISIKHDKDIEH